MKKDQDGSKNKIILVIRNAMPSRERSVLRLAIEDFIKGFGQQLAVPDFVKRIVMPFVFAALIIFAAAKSTVWIQWVMDFSNTVATHYEIFQIRHLLEITDQEGKELPANKREFQHFLSSHFRRKWVGKDRWMNDYEYERTVDEKFTVKSRGKDGKLNTADDIVFSN